MKRFIDIEEVDEWFAPMSFEQFWDEADLFQLTTPERARCKRMIHEGEVDAAEMLDGLKYLARHELAKRQGLRRRPTKVPDIDH